MTMPDTPHQPDGGPAFPSKSIYRDSQGIDHEVNDTGISKRDWFAGMATEDDIAAHTVWKFNDDVPVEYPPFPDCTREQARYRYADAMLAAREGGAA